MSQHCSCCAVCGDPALSLQRLRYTDVVVHVEEVTELEKRNEQLEKDNAALDTENEKYWGTYVLWYEEHVICSWWAVGGASVLSGLPCTEEVDELKRKIEGMEAKLEEWQCVCLCACVGAHLNLK